MLCILHGLLWILLILGLDTFRSGDREYIILHYKIFFGTDFVARWFSIYLLPLVGLAVLGVTIFLQGAVYHIERRLAYALSFTALLVQALLLVGLALLIQINLY